MYPDGFKDTKCEFRNLKLFFHPYYFLMLNYFFKDGLPKYDCNSFDKPNDYNEDVELASKLHFTFILKEGLVCFASHHSKLLKTIAC